MEYQDMTRMPVAQRTDKQYMDWYLEVQEGKNAEELGKLRNLMEQDIVYCKIRHLVDHGLILVSRYKRLFGDTEFAAFADACMEAWIQNEKEKERCRVVQTKAYYEIIVRPLRETQCTVDLLNGKAHIFDVPFVYRDLHAYYCAHLYALSLCQKEEQLAANEEIASFMLLDMLEYAKRGNHGASKQLELNYNTTFLNTLYI